MNPAANTIGIIELASIYKGFEVQDAVLKYARVEKLLARTICSGKYLIMVRGDIADVDECLNLAQEMGDFAIISAMSIPKVDEAIFPAITGTTALDGQTIENLVLLETFSVAAVIKAVDIALHAADIGVLRIHVAMAIGGKGFAILTGDAEALQSAIIPALDFLKEDGSLAGYTLITNPHPDLLCDLS